MKVSISVVTSDIQLSSDFVTVDVSPGISLLDLKGLIEAECGAPAKNQMIMQNGDAVTDDSKTLAQLNVVEGDLLGLSVQSNQDQRAAGPSARRGQARPTSHTDTSVAIEQVRQHMLRDSRVMDRARQEFPRLAEVAHDRDRFHAAYQERSLALRSQQQEIERQQRELMDSDFFDVDAQRRIEEQISQEMIAQNMETAMEENPAAFGRVTMLYIDVMVNKTPIKAFVDSGAQTTIMSPDAAERCGITRLIDKRFGGIARGVGTAKIIGRVHHAIVQLGQYQAPASFTVMEGKDVDLLLGLDMLRAHQMCIDLGQNCLRVQDAEIPFLPEHQIPKMMDDVLDMEPKVEGPGGSTVGATTGTVEIPARGSRSRSAGEAASSIAGTSQQAARSTGQQQPPLPSGVTPQAIAQVMDLGFSREEAILALQQADGNVELALGILL